MGVELAAIQQMAAGSIPMDERVRADPGKIAVRDDERGAGRAQTEANANPNSCVARFHAKSVPFSFRPLDCSVIVCHLSLIWARLAQW
jgi:hypothetical protein